MSNGKIIGPTVDCDIVTTSGVWDLNDVYSQRIVYNWPRSPATITYRTSTANLSNTNVLTLVHPPDVVVGDLCVLFHVARDNVVTDSVTTVPSTFLPLQIRTTADGTGNLSMTTSYSILSSTANVSLPSTTRLTDGSNTQALRQCLIALYFYMDRNIERVLFREFDWDGTSDDPAAQTLNINNYTTLPLILFAAQAISTGTPAFSSGTFDGTVSNEQHPSTAGPRCIVGYNIYNNFASSSFTFDMNDISTQQLQGLIISVH